ncbi:MAG: hypothetical protein R3F13_04980 [Prosthecobacter sp.]
MIANVCRDITINNHLIDSIVMRQPLLVAEIPILSAIERRIHPEQATGFIDMCCNGQAAVLFNNPDTFCERF